METIKQMCVYVCVFVYEYVNRMRQWRFGQLQLAIEVIFFFVQKGNVCMCM